MKTKLIPVVEWNKDNPDYVFVQRNGKPRTKGYVVINNVKNPIYIDHKPTPNDRDLAWSTKKFV